MKRLVLPLILVLLALPLAQAQQKSTTDPLNNDPLVRDGYTHFYNLDYDGALIRFEQVLREHPDDPMADNYVLMTIIFRELYRQDLLDTTYYAHDNFLTNKRSIQIPPQIRQRTEDLLGRIEQLTSGELEANPRDANAYFARGYARGLHAAFITLADHSFFAAARQGLASRNDSEAALKIDPNYFDADMAIGIQQFAVASLPRFVRMVVGIAGVGGNKQHGLTLLQQSAVHGIVTSVESRTALALFLRHDARYPEAYEVEHSLATEFPHDYLFRLEEANIAKDAGNGPLAIATYKQVLADAAKPGYFVDPRLQLAWFGLADTERGYNDLKDAVHDYLEAANQPNNSDWIRKRAELAAGEVLDREGDRQAALEQYRLAAAPGGDQSQADTARKLLNAPYTGK